MQHLVEAEHFVALMHVMRIGLNCAQKHSGPAVMFTCDASEPMANEL